MTIHLTENKAGDATSCYPGTSVSVAFPQNVAAGSLLVALVSDYNQVPPTDGVKKSDGTNQFTRACVCGGSTNRIATAIYFLPDAPGGAFTVKYTAPGSSYCTLHIIEIVGAALSNVLDNTQITASYGSSGTPEPDADVTHAQNAAVVGVFADESASVAAISPGTNFTPIFEHENGNTGTVSGSEAILVSGSGSIRVYHTMTNQAAWFACAASFKEALTAGVPTPHFRNRLDVIRGRS